MILRGLILSLLPWIIAPNPQKIEKATDLIATKLLKVRSSSIKRCHSCITNKAGALRIILVSTSFTHYTYLVIATASFDEALLAECNGYHTCTFTTAISKTEVNLKEYSVS